MIKKTINIPSNMPSYGGAVYQRIPVPLIFSGQHRDIPYSPLSSEEHALFQQEMVGIASYYGRINSHLEQILLGNRDAFFWTAQAAKARWNLGFTGSRARPGTFGTRIFIPQDFHLSSWEGASPVGEHTVLAATINDSAAFALCGFIATSCSLTSYEMSIDMVLYPRVPVHNLPLPGEGCEFIWLGCDSHAPGTVVYTTTDLTMRGMFSKAGQYNIRPMGVVFGTYEYLMRRLTKEVNNE